MPSPKHILIGIAAGLAGSLVMQQFRTAWNRRYPDPRDGVFGLDKEADIKSSNLLANFTCGCTLSDEQAERLALYLHYAYGSLAGVLYTLCVANSSVARTGYGTLFGTAVWLFGDELPITISGISNPFARSTRSHTSAFIAHLLFGATLELTHRHLQNRD